MKYIFLIMILLAGCGKPTKDETPKYKYLDNADKRANDTIRERNKLQAVDNKDARQLDNTKDKRANTTLLENNKDARQLDNTKDKRSHFLKDKNLDLNAQDKREERAFQLEVMKIKIKAQQDADQRAKNEVLKAQAKDEIQRLKQLREKHLEAQRKADDKQLEMHKRAINKEIGTLEDSLLRLNKAVNRLDNEIADWREAVARGDALAKVAGENIKTLERKRITLETKVLNIKRKLSRMK